MSGSTTQTKTDKPGVGCERWLCGTEDDWAVIREALERWGEHEQMMMAAGECGEFLTHYGRIVQGRFDADAFASEIADVVIMMHSMALIVGPERVGAEVERKLSRLRAKLDACAT